MYPITKVLVPNLAFAFQNFEPKYPNLGILGQTKFLYCKGGNFKSDICFQKFWTKIPKGGDFEPKSINLLFLMKFCLYPCYKGADFKSDIRFQKFWAQTPKFWHFESKGINFLTLTNFCLYPVLKVLISNQTFVFKTFKPKSPNFGVLDQKKSTF